MPHRPRHYPALAAHDTPYDTCLSRQRRPRPLWWASAYGLEGAAVNDGDGTSRRGQERRFGPLGTALVIIPTYNEAENIKPIVAPGAEGRARGARPRRRRQQPRRHRQARRRTGRRGRPRPCAAPQGQGGPRRRLPRGLPLGHRARLRRPGRDGRRRLPPARGTAPAADRPQGRRPGPRLALGARRPGGELAQVPRVHLPRRQHSTPGCCSTSRSATSPAATAPSARETLEGPRPRRGRLPGLLLPGRPRPPRGHGRLPRRRGARSPSSSASSATPR